MAADAGKIYALTTILLLLAIIFPGLRFWARAVKKQVLGWDDYMIVPALVCSCLCNKHI